MYEALRREVMPRLEKHAAVLREAGFGVDIETPLGFPAAEIQRIASEQDAKLIVARPHGASLARGKLLGSAASQLLHRAQLPLLLVRVQLLEEGGVRCRARKRAPRLRVSAVLHHGHEAGLSEREQPRASLPGASS